LSPKRTLSGWLTNRYLLIIRNEENFAEKKTFSFNYARVILVMALGFIFTLLLSVYLVIYVLEQWLDPRHAEMVANRQLIDLSMRIDSLEREVKAKDEFIFNVQKIFDGSIENSENEFSRQEINMVASGEKLFTENLTAVDSQFRVEYEKEDLGLISFNESSSEELIEIYFFEPIKGIISQRFNLKNEHFGTDIVGKENEPIKAIADGVVVFSSWTLDGGYVIALQHRGNLMSVYKHNSELLKNVGNFVSSGEIISIIGNTGELTTGPHLHFEVWHKGNPLDPENFFTF